MTLSLMCTKTRRLKQEKLRLYDGRQIVWSREERSKTFKRTLDEA